MTQALPAGFANFILIVLAMSAAGILHMFWLSSRFAKRVSLPIDGGLTFRGHRIFGPNKTWKGLCAMPFTAASSFALVQIGIPHFPPFLQEGWWVLSIAQSAGLGWICGLMFMLAELPNSFIKRQCGIAAGSLATGKGTRMLFSLTDRCDSVLGLVITLWFFVPTRNSTLLYLIVLGPAVHALFSMLQFQLGLKGRAL
jgi:hypothetical protein